MDNVLWIQSRGQSQATYKEKRSLGAEMDCNQCTFLVPRAMGSDDICSVDLKLLWWVTAICLLILQLPILFEWESLYCTYSVSVSLLHVGWGWEKITFLFFIHIYRETEMLFPKNYTWRNLFSSALKLDEKILILKPWLGTGPDVIK